MSKISKETVEHVARLARLRLQDAEKEALAEVLSAVLQNFEALSAVETKGIEPLVTPTDMTFSMRDDVAVEVPGASEKLLGSAPERAGRLYQVPPVV